MTDGGPPAGKDVESKVSSLARRRGFYWPAYEIYGGAAGLYDYGPLGAALRTNLESLWRRHFVLGEGFAEISTPTLAPEPVFKASGHIDTFSDLLVECTKCGEAYRADHLLAGRDAKIPPGMTPAEADRFLADLKVVCPQCGGALSPTRPFNLMFRTNFGPGSKRAAYLRPETAQAMFTTFVQALRHFREKLPFGVVQLGTAYRNEIAPRHGLLRLREFHQMEAEVFVHPQEKRHARFGEVADDRLTLVPNAGAAGEMTAAESVTRHVVAHEALAYYVARTQRFLLDAGIDRQRLRFRQHEKSEMAHYAADCWDAEVELGGSWVEIVGIADRTTYDLDAHARHSGTDLSAFVPLAAPRTVRRLVITPDPKQLGPLFRGKAKEVAELLVALDTARLPASGDIAVELADGSTVTVPRAMVRIGEQDVRETGQRVVPHVIEPSFGVDRILYAVLEHAYRETQKEGESYVVLRLAPRIAPVTVAVLPLMGKDGLDTAASALHRQLADRGVAAQYDDGGSIGRRYARNDEIGTPLALTVDYDTLTDGTVTLRDRDSAAQIRLPSAEALAAAVDAAAGRLRFGELAGRWASAGEARIRP